MEVHRSLSLFQFMCDEGLVPSPEEDLKRGIIIDKLNTIVLKWIRRVAWQRGLPANVIKAASATVLPYGSYGLGVHNSESDVDALCVGPCYASRAEDFFVVLCNMLKNTPGVCDVHSVKDAKVPLMRFRFDGILIDMSYAQLQVTYVPESVAVADLVSLTGIDDTSRKSLSGVRANQSILQLVPNLQNFQSLLRCIKYWARRRGVYGTLFGYLGGIHLGIMAAFICVKNPNAGLSTLVTIFFDTFASWPWPKPVTLQDGMAAVKEEGNENISWMPIRLPYSQFEFCQSNITRGTFNRIRTEFFRGHSVTKDFLGPDFVWDGLFESLDYQKRYSWFLKIYLSACGKGELEDWIGWVKSRFRCLINKMEEARRSCDPNPTEYVETIAGEVEPSVVFCWGLLPNRCTHFNLTSIEQDFRNVLNEGPTGMIRLSIVPAAEFPSTARFPAGKRKGTKACWRVLDYGKQITPAFSVHRPNHFIGYAVVPCTSQVESDLVLNS